MKHLLILLGLVLAGCATTAVDPEAAREVALQYINSDVGTTGPFNKNRTGDLDVLSADDRAKALALLDRGAVGFVAFGNGAAGGASRRARIVLVLEKKVVGDFWAVQAAAN
jgi:hypothetical protein